MKMTFRNAMQRAGIETDDLLNADAKLHRVHIRGDRKGAKNGWYILYPDYPTAGAFGCFKRGITENWTDRGMNIDEQSRLILSSRIVSIWECRKSNAAAEREQGMKKALAEWSAATPANGKHSYLLKKQVAAYGIRYRYGKIMIPLQDSAGEISGIQYIDHSGNKWFCKGTVKSGHYFLIGVPKNIILIAEGYATSATIHEATGYAVAVAFDSGNLTSVGISLRATYPDATFIICADDDHASEGNPGLSKAIAAAQATAALIAKPVFKSPNIGTDFNDLYLSEGAAAVTRCIADACGGEYV